MTFLKCGTMAKAREWNSSEAADLHLTKEELEIFERYIPQYFGDNAPPGIRMSGAFQYEPGNPEWFIPWHRECGKDQEDRKPACSALSEVLYIGPDMVLAPCQMMCDTVLASELPNLREKPLRLPAIFSATAEERITAAAQPAFGEYIRRNTIKQ